MKVYIRRINEIEAMTQIDISGSLSSILVSEVEKNTITKLEYRYKKTSDEAWSSWSIFYPTSTSSTSWSFTDMTWISFEPEYS